jgi:hypothetical protein
MILELSPYRYTYTSEKHIAPLSAVLGSGASLSMTPFRDIPALGKRHSVYVGLRLSTELCF